jgi:hypothetical protein
MGNRYKRSLIGYKPDEVRIRVEQISDEFDRKYDEQKQILSNLTEENVKLKEELEQLRRAVSEHKEPKLKMGELLYNMHIKASKVVYDADKKSKQIIQEKTDILRHQENKNLEIKLSINKLLKEVHSILED